MNITIATDIHVYCENNRFFVTERMSRILPRYFESFGKYSLIARSSKEKPQADLYEITHLVERCYLFKNLKDLYFSNFRKTIAEVVRGSDLVIGRFESFSGLVCFQYAKAFGVRFMGEVMSDPWDGLWNHGFVGKLIAPYAFFKTKVAMKKADFGLYVTQSFLQRRYPCPNRTVGVSNVYLGGVDSSVLEKRIEKIDVMALDEITIMTTAATYVRYKGQQYVIDAIPLLNRDGIRVKYIIVGDGDQHYLRNRAKKKGVENQVFFTGRLQFDRIKDHLDKVDIYIQPSLQEGLPRAVIEAMSRACPCLGTGVAGIPELLKPNCLFGKKSGKKIYRAIKSVWSREALRKMAVDNFNASLLFEDSILSKRRKEYFDYVCSAINVSSRQTKEACSKRK